MNKSDLKKLTEILAEANNAEEMTDRVRYVASALSLNISAAICPTNDILAPIAVVVLEKYKEAFEQRLTPGGKELVALLNKVINHITISNTPLRETEDAQ